MKSQRAWLGCCACAMLIGIAGGCVDQKRFDTVQQERDQYKMQLDNVTAERDAQAQQAQAAKEAMEASTAALVQTQEELAAAREVLGAPPTPEGLADLLWLVFMLPEFQLVR